MNIVAVLIILDQTYPELEMHRVGKTPFKTLVATLISQRARDEQTIPVARKLFSVASNPKDMLQLPLSELHSILKPAGKYRQNANRIRAISHIIIRKYGGKVPENEKDLLSLPGVGRKTTNIVLAHSFGKDAIAVDTHVHRITNRLGWLKTKTPLETERFLQKIVPKKHWRIVNRVFVRHGQTLCTPFSPFCSKCPISKYCQRVGVQRTR